MQNVNMQTSIHRAKAKINKDVVYGKNLESQDQNIAKSAYTIAFISLETLYINSNFSIKIKVMDDDNILFKPGEIIQGCCEPFMKILSNSHKGSLCDFCFKSDPSCPLRRCTSCKHVYYCNKPCQVNDWMNVTYHTSSVKMIILQYFHKKQLISHRLLRLFSILTLHPHRAQKQYQICDGTQRCFDNLMSHQDHTEQNPLFVKYCSEIRDRLIIEESPGLNSTESDPLLLYFLKLSGLLRTNAFCIYNENKTEKIGAGLYIETSVFDHSCRPTAFFLLKGTSIQIRAICPILKGSQPLISYILAHKGRNERQKFLRERYHFNCQCERCEEEESKTVDTDRIQQLLESSSAFNQTTPWTLVLKTHKEIMNAFRVMYSEYHERITNQFHLTFTKLVQINMAKGCPIRASLSFLRKQRIIYW